MRDYVVTVSVKLCLCGRHNGLTRNLFRNPVGPLWLRFRQTIVSGKANSDSFKQAQHSARDAVTSTASAAVGPGGISRRWSVSFVVSFSHVDSHVVGLFHCD